MASAARPIAMVLDEQAATTQPRGPSKPKRSAIDVDRRAEKMIPDIRRARPIDAGGDPGPIELLVAQQVCGAGSQENPDPRGVHAPLPQSRIVYRLGGCVQSNAIASRQTASLERGERRVDLLHRNLRPRCGCDTPRHRTPSPDQSRTRPRPCAATTLPASAPSAVTRPTPVMATRGLIGCACTAPHRRLGAGPPETGGHPALERAHLPSFAQLASRRDGKRQELERQRPDGEAETGGATPAAVIRRLETREAGDVAADHAVGIRAGCQRASLAPSRTSEASAHARQELVAIAARGFGPGRADTPQRVRVAARHGRQARPAVDRCPRRRNLLRQPVVRRHHGAVSDLERRHHVEQSQIGVERHARLVEMQQMVEREEHRRLPEARDEVEDVPSKRLELAVERFGHPVHAEMDLKAAVRQPARDLFPHDDVARVRHPLDQRERAVDRVVIGDGDEVHAARLGHRVDRFGPGIAIARAEEGEVVVVA